MENEITIPVTLYRELVTCKAVLESILEAEGEKSVMAAVDIAHKVVQRRKGGN